APVHQRNGRLQAPVIQSDTPFSALKASSLPSRLFLSVPLRQFLNLSLPLSHTPHTHTHAPTHITHINTPTHINAPHTHTCTLTLMSHPSQTHHNPHTHTSSCNPTHTPTHNPPHTTHPHTRHHT